MAIYNPRVYLSAFIAVFGFVLFLLLSWKNAASPRPLAGGSETSGSAPDTMVEGLLLDRCERET
jgi:hypothetical protein